MWVLRQWKSMQKCRPPSFFQINTTALDYALCLGQIMPESNISHRYVQISFTSGGGICLNHSLNRVSLVTLITCLVEWVQLSSLGSNEKTCGIHPREIGWNLPDWVGMIPIHSDITPSNKFSCLCFAVILGVWRPFVSSNVSITPVCKGGFGTLVTATILTTGAFFSESQDTLYFFSLTWQHSCCHHATPYTCSALWDPEVKTHLQCEGPKSSCLSPLLCEPSPSSHVWQGTRRHQWSQCPWWWLLHHFH